MSSQCSSEWRTVDKPRSNFRCCLQHEQQHWEHVAACLSWSLVLRSTWRCNSQCGTSHRRAWTSQLTLSQANAGLIEVDAVGRSMLYWCWWHACQDSDLMKSWHRGLERHHSWGQCLLQAAQTDHGYQAKTKDPCASPQQLGLVHVQWLITELVDVWRCILTMIV